MRLGAVLGLSWGRLGAILGPSWGHLGAILGPSWAILWPVWAILGDPGEVEDTCRHVHPARSAPEITAIRRFNLGWHERMGEREQTIAANAVQSFLEQMSQNA